MAKKSNIYQIIFLMFLLIAFGLGAYVYSTMDIKQMIARMEGMDTLKNQHQSPQPVTPEGCPDLLIQRGPSYYLYNTKMPVVNGSNPIVFNSLEEYSGYFNLKNSTAKQCPPLFLQQENDTQGSDVYRIRPSPFNPFAGVPANSPLVQKYDGKLVDEMDASRDNGYNKNMYPGFDPENLHIGRLTELDKIHESTENTKISDNPMDSNWGGVLYTQSQVDSGKYVENEVSRTNYATPKGAQMLPIYGPSQPYP
jgi:hypothetical protein